MSRLLHITLRAPLCATGVGTFAQYLAHELILLEKQRRIHLTLETRTCAPSLTPERTKILYEKLIRNQWQDIRPDWVVDLSLPAQFVRGTVKNGTRVASWPMWETKVTRSFFDPLDRADLVLASSSWAHDTLANYGFESIDFVPAGISDLLSPVESLRPVIDRAEIVHVGKFEARKGIQELLEGLQLLDRHVNLHGYWFNPWAPNAAAQALQKAGYTYEEETTGQAAAWTKGRVAVRIHPSVVHQYDLLLHMRGADLAIYPHRGEGWGMPVIDSIGLGVPTLASAHTGGTDYMRSYQDLLDSALLPEASNLLLREHRAPAEDGIFFRESTHGSWSTMDPQEITGKTIQILDQPSHLRAVYPIVAARMRDLFSWRRCAETLIQVLHDHS